MKIKNIFLFEMWIVLLALILVCASIKFISYEPYFTGALGLLIGYLVGVIIDE